MRSAEGQKVHAEAIASWDERNREYVNRRKRNLGRRHAAIIKNPRLGDWSPAEDAIALRTDITRLEKSVMLQRSVRAVDRRITTLGRPTFVCGSCGKEHFSARNSRRFCSPECRSAASKQDRKERVCPTCSAGYTPAFNSSRKKYCSKSCAYDAVRVHHPTNCPVCDEVFTPYVSSLGPTRYCSQKCSGDAQRVHGPKKCAVCAVVFQSVDSRAKYCTRDCFVDSMRKVSA